MQGHATPNYLTATPEEVIRTSILWHPATLAERLLGDAATHQAYVHTTRDATAARIAGKAAIDARYAARLVTRGRDEDIARLLRDLSLMVPTLNHACKLQCVPQFAKEIAGRWVQPS